jgi:hypothetical protein
MASAPGASAAGLFPAAARTNPAIFYDREGNSRSLADIRSAFAQKLATGSSSASGAFAPADGADSYSLPAGARMVLPADYLRIAQALRGTSGAQLPETDASRIMSVADPDAAGPDEADAPEDFTLLQSLQARTLDRDAPAPPTTAQALAYPAAPAALAPRAETARLAYLMLATLGR